MRRDVAHERARLAADFVRDPRMVEAVLEALIASASSADAIISWDVKGTILAWSPAATRIFGHRAEDVVGVPITILIPPELRGEEAAFMAALQRGEQIENVDTERVTKDGRRISVSLTISPAVDASGAVVAATAICRDLTATRAGEAAQATLAAIVQSSDDAIVGKTLEGRIVSWNAGAERLFGYSKEEAVGKPITMLLPPERISEEATILATLIRGDRIDHFETERVRKDGRRIRVSLSVSPIRDGSGTIIGAAKIARDVTQRRALEEERDRLLAREQEARATAEAANRAKDAFLATVSHELPTPLSPILAWTSMLRQRTLAEGQTEKALATIERNARAQAQLIEDLLDISRIVSGKMRLEVRPTDLAAVIHAAVDVVGPAAAAKETRRGCSRSCGISSRTRSSSRPSAVASRSCSSASTRTSRSRSATPARVSTPGFCRTSSSASGKPTAPRAACTAGSDSVSPSSATSSSCTAAPCMQKARGPATARPSR